MVIIGFLVMATVTQMAANGDGAQEFDLPVPFELMVLAVRYLRPIEGIPLSLRLGRVGNPNFRPKLSSLHLFYRLFVYLSFHPS